jgi:hypothetical protein
VGEVKFFNQQVISAADLSCFFARHSHLGIEIVMGLSVGAANRWLTIPFNEMLMPACRHLLPSQQLVNHRSRNTREDADGLRMLQIRIEKL